MTERNSGDPLHGVTLENILRRLVEHYGWEEMGRAIKEHLDRDYGPVRLPRNERP